MYHFSIPMALMDFVPVVFFGITAVLLLNDLHNKMGKGIYALFAAGCVNVFMAGFLKALWKLLYAAGICDFRALEEMFLPVNSLGLLFVGIGLILMVSTGKKNVMLSAAPVAYASSMPFILMMVLGLGGMCAGLSILSVKMKKGKVMILYILSFVCAMGMGFMASQDMTLAWVNWAEQGINIASQLFLMLGTIALHRANLKDFAW